MKNHDDDLRVGRLFDPLDADGGDAPDFEATLTAAAAAARRSRARRLRTRTALVGFATVVVVAAVFFGDVSRTPPFGDTVRSEPAPEAVSILSADEEPAEEAVTEANQPTVAAPAPVAPRNEAPPAKLWSPPGEPRPPATEILKRLDEETLVAQRIAEEGKREEQRTVERDLPAAPPPQQRILVQAKTPLIDKSKTGNATVLPSEGYVRDAEGDGNPNVHGRRSRDFKTMVDGVSNVGLLTGQEVRFAADSHDMIRESGFKLARREPLSTFSIDVDTASYSIVRRHLNEGRMPPVDAVRIEELLNYFRYRYPEPRGEHPVAADVEIADCPWAPGHQLARIGLAATPIPRTPYSGSNIVLLLDVSGSMDSPDKLPLVKQALSLFVRQLGSRDQLSIVVYAGASGTVLRPTRGSDHETILAALDRLSAGGGTNGGEGLALAYDLAAQRFIPGGVNRVILATDGDFNLGVTGSGDLVSMIRKKAEAGIFLTVLGVGMGNLKDDRMEALADQGDGHYAYLDTLEEARRVLVEQIGSTLVTVAKDVKVQVEFNPAHVGAYRLIGYENRALTAEEFIDDGRDAGEMGAGHTVTALYELVPPELAVEMPQAVALRYQTLPQLSEMAGGDEWLTVRVRYKQPTGMSSRLFELPYAGSPMPLAGTSRDFRFAAAVAAFGLALRESEHRGDASLELAFALARESAGGDRSGARRAFVELLKKALELEYGR